MSLERLPQGLHVILKFSDLMRDELFYYAPQDFLMSQLSKVNYNPLVKER